MKGLQETFVQIKELTEVKSMLTKLAEEIEARGEKRGIQQGILQGAQQKALETARRMKEKGYAIAEIADVTGLTIEEIEKL
jgi:predicted transposase/invertase (TIGR01784 family)